MAKTKEEETVDEVRSKEKLEEFIGKKITKVFEAALDLIEVVLDEESYKKVRSKILRVGNNSIREVEEEIRNYYRVLYHTDKVDIVTITGGGKENG
jgi:hypothetical protein